MAPAWHKYGPYKRFKAPPQTGWSWVNQGNATATFNGGALVLEDPDLDTTNPQLRLYVRSLGAGATNVTAAFAWNGIGTDAACMGICARDIGGTDDGNFSGWGLKLTSGQPVYLHYKYYTSATVVEQPPHSTPHTLHFPHDFSGSSSCGREPTSSGGFRLMGSTGSSGTRRVLATTTRPASSVSSSTR